MSILIKELNMKEIVYCPFCGEEYGECLISKNREYCERLEKCPYEIIPDHGDLIEKEYAIASACSGRIRALPTTEDGEDWIRVEEVRQSLKSVPVVIPAERSEE